MFVSSATILEAQAPDRVSKEADLEKHKMVSAHTKAVKFIRPGALWISRQIEYTLAAFERR
jgi:hypothetical protein